MFSESIIETFRQIRTPFYYYDMDLLRRTLAELKALTDRYGYTVHYALKANAEERVLREISSLGFGADCVSGNEVKRALASGFAAEEIVFAGVGKTDEEIDFALDTGIFCFNCESEQEVAVINELARAKGRVASIALRVNPDIEASTHRHISTGKADHKFGMSESEVDSVIDRLGELDAVHLSGIHFHIGSQILELDNYRDLAKSANRIQAKFKAKGVEVAHINLGGGLGVDYFNPDKHPIADFAGFFAAIHEALDVFPEQKVHFELGRSIVCQMGSLISRVLYTKSGAKKRFAIVDAGMTELLRPALYQSFHRIQNLSNQTGVGMYDVVGPICESSDTFGTEVMLPETNRGDLLAIRSAGAYGQMMASKYNLRDEAKAYYSDDLVVESRGRGVAVGC